MFKKSNIKSHTVFLILIVLFARCNKINPKVESLELKVSDLLKDYISINKNNEIQYLLFKYWEGYKLESKYIPCFRIAGKLSYDKGMVMIKSSTSKTSHVLFNFNLKQKQKQKVIVEECYEIKKRELCSTVEYSLMLDTIFIDRKKRNIYSFRFENFEICSKPNNVVFFVTDSLILVGVYTSYYNSELNNSEKIISYRGEMFW